MYLAKLLIYKYMRSDIMIVKSIGFPRIKNYAGDVRDFLPSLFGYLKQFDHIEIFVEKNYGSGLGLTEDDYKEENNNIQFVSADDIYQKDLIIILKMPELSELEKLKCGCSIFTMCHYSTRPAYVDLFKRKNIFTFSMDGITDDYGKRLFVDYFRTAFNGSIIAFEELKKSYDDFYSNHRLPIYITILGVGMVAQNCAKSFEILSDEAFLNMNITGAIMQLLPRTITNNEAVMTNILKSTDILVDATKRVEINTYVIKNEMLAYLPQHAIILDITADRYDSKQVKPIEGTVLGNLQSYIIYPNDKRYDALPDGVNSTNKRTTVSCDAWPGTTPTESIKFYEILLKDYINVIMSKELSNISINSNNYFERALYRGTLNYFLQ
jgi:alanine dehydrogenase